MALPTGLIPIFAFVLTIGIALPITLGAHLFYRTSNSSFTSALRIATLEAVGLYVVGVIVVDAIAGGGGWRGIVILLFMSGVLEIILMVVPLVLGQRLIRGVGDVDSETALRYATYGWPLTMLVVYAIFVAPGGFILGHPFMISGERLCLAGHCGRPGSALTWILVLELVVAVLGPGTIGLAILSRSDNVRSASDS